MKMSGDLLKPDEVILAKIHELRGLKVMIDRDLAELFGAETRVLKQAVRRNLNRFPPDFMFEMSQKELENWRSQFVISKKEQMGLRYAPFCFTEQGVTMLSCVLNSSRAIDVNIRVVRTFTKMREMLLTHKDLLLEMEEIRKKVGGQDEKIELIFNYLRQFVQEQGAARVGVGFKR
jgi:phage regulator Rha-like protein